MASSVSTQSPLSLYCCSKLILAGLVLAGLRSLAKDLHSQRDGADCPNGKHCPSHSLVLFEAQAISEEKSEAYAEDLESLGWPIPREILQDIRLRRALLAAPMAYAPDKRA